jgi:2-polyprenyl-3-methyl-5-hydroxy-6-metoxy-1,4-benzoquinol methylase
MTPWNGPGTTWDGEEYQRRFEALASSGHDVHGEVAFIDALAPRPVSVLDAGCGTGLIAIELARRGYDVVGVDVDASMLAVARTRAPELEWHEHDLATLDLERRFDAVVLAGNVLLFVAPGTEAQVVARCAAHVGPNGVLVAGFSLRPGAYDLSSFDEHCVAAGLHVVERWATWDREPFAGGDYAVSVLTADD